MGRNPLKGKAPSKVKEEEKKKVRNRNQIRQSILVQPGLQIAMYGDPSLYQPYQKWIRIEIVAHSILQTGRLVCCASSFLIDMNQFYRACQNDFIE